MKTRWTATLSEKQAWVYRLLQQLGPMSCREIAEQLGISESSAFRVLNTDTPKIRRERTGNRTLFHAN